MCIFELLFKASQNELAVVYCPGIPAVDCIDGTGKDGGLAKQSYEDSIIFVLGILFQSIDSGLCPGGTDWGWYALCSSPDDNISDTILSGSCVRARHKCVGRGEG